MAKKPKTQNRFGNSNIPTPSTTQEKPAISPLIQQVTGEIFNKEQEALFAKENVLREEILVIIERCKQVQEDLQLEKQQYEEKNRSLLEQQTELNLRNTELAHKEQKVKSDIENLDIQRYSLNQDKELFSNERKTLIKDTLILTEAQNTLAEDKSNAELGFAAEKQRALEEKRQALDKLQAESLKKLSNDSQRLAQKEAELFEREQKLIQDESEAKAGFIELKNQLIREWQQEKQEQEQNLIKERRSLEQKATEIQLAQEALNLEQAQFDAQVTAMRNSIRHDFSVQITKLKASNENLEQSHNQALDEIEQLTSKLQQYADLERQLSGQGVLSIQEELNTLRVKNRDLKAQLSERYEEGLQEENERLEQQLSDVEEQLFDLRQQNNELNHEINNNRLSVLDKQHLQQEKRVLEQHKRVLDTSITQLQTQIDDLVEKQQGELPFKALSEMDNLYRDEARSLQSVPELKQFAQIMQANIAKQSNPDAKVIEFSIKDIRLFIAGLAMSKLHLLQGISGTGKTTIARAFAKSINNVSSEDQEKLYCEIVRVQAGWRDREDLLGHFNAFEKRFYTKEALQALYRAQQPKFADTLQIILLDEMNLSQPEQYFADFLSLMETPDRAEINLLDSANEKTPRLFVDHRAIKIPQNVWFIGTANHDETTKEFADKTYDRAHVMEVKRSTEVVDIANANAEQYSYASLMQRFKQAQQQYQPTVNHIFQQLKESALEKSLHSIGVSWGNRLERQAQVFIPVYMAMGGTASEALDHLLATKVFRRGKVTGRYDTRNEKIEAILFNLEKIWEELGFTESPETSWELLQQDIERLKGNL